MASFLKKLPLPPQTATVLIFLEIGVY